MGVFAIKVWVGTIEKPRCSLVEAKVDTGAFLSLIPRRILQEAGVRPRWRRRFTLANGQRIVRDVGVAGFRVDGREGASEVAFGEGADKALIGALTLEALGLKVSPRKRKLEPEELLLL